MIIRLLFLVLGTLSLIGLYNVLLIYGGTKKSSRFVFVLLLIATIIGGVATFIIYVFFFPYEPLFSF
ncbi:hypothetical protein MKZ08_18115 [Viridibacillus sp. FSL R5-0477]|uniref:hypothetical protein n=1 Tax=Viridibacillus TaxID=496496 RepID=UPI00117F3F92|nr:MULTISPECIES: hypothetical protein [Viridibacillus]